MSKNFSNLAQTVEQLLEEVKTLRYQVNDLNVKFTNFETKHFKKQDEISKILKLLANQVSLQKEIKGKFKSKRKDYIPNKKNRTQNELISNENSIGYDKENLKQFENVQCINQTEKYDFRQNTNVGIEIKTEYLSETETENVTVKALETSSKNSELNNDKINEVQYNRFKNLFYQLMNEMIPKSGLFLEWKELLKKYESSMNDIIYKLKVEIDFDETKFKVFKKRLLNCRRHEKFRFNKKWKL